jgi:hypothetical protein
MSITAVEAVPISGQVRSDLAIISSLGQHLVGQYVLVRIRDDAGRVGLGEASVTAVWSGETQAGTIAMVGDVLAPLVIGADPFDIEWISQRMEKAAFGNSFARAAIEMALLDLQGKTLGVPVYRLLGGKASASPSPLGGEGRGEGGGNHCKGVPLTPNPSPPRGEGRQGHPPQVCRRGGGTGCGGAAGGTDGQARLAGDQGEGWPT